MALPAGYAWLPRYDGSQVWNVDPRNALATAFLCALLASVVALPPVATALQLDPWWGAIVIASYGARSLLFLPFLRGIRERPRLLEARLILEVVHGVAVVVALVVATGEPLTPLWAVAPLYASMDGADFDFPPIALYAALHTFAPLAAIPFFLAAGAPLATAVGVSAFFALVSFISYQYTATRKAAVRAAFRERDGLRARLGEERMEAERERVGRRLAASIGERLQRARASSHEAVTEAARAGLGELREVLDTLAASPPEPASRTRERSRIYRALPIVRDLSWNSSRTDLVVAAALAAAVAAALWIPAVSAAVGLRHPLGAWITSVFPVWTLAWASLPDRVRRTPRGIRALYVGSLLVGSAIAVSLPVAAGDPRSPLWALPVMYASFNGSDYEVEPSWLHVALKAGGPLVTIPIFLAMGAPTASSVGAPLLFAALCFLAFHYGAQRARVVREVHAERDRLADELAAARASRQRERLARDLHDSVGSSLSLAAIYGDMLQQARGDASAAERLAAGVACAADQSLADLRGLLEGLVDDGDETDVCAMIRRRAERLAAPAGVAVEVRGSGTLRLRPAERLAILRIAEEAIANALRHSGAGRIEVALEGGLAEARLAVVDDGRGIDEARSGRGLGNMRARAEELGGALTIESGAGGTRVSATIPLHEGGA